MAPAQWRALTKALVAAAFALAVVALTRDWTLGTVLFAAFGIGYLLGYTDAEEEYEDDEY